MTPRWRHLLLSPRLASPVALCHIILFYLLLSQHSSLKLPSSFICRWFVFPIKTLALRRVGTLSDLFTAVIPSS